MLNYSTINTISIMNINTDKTTKNKGDLLDRIEADVDSHQNEINNIEERTGEVEGAIGEVENLRNLF